MKCNHLPSKVHSLDKDMCSLMIMCVMYVLSNCQNSYWGDHGWLRNDTNDTQARQAYESLLRVSLLQPRDPKFKSFADEVKENAYRDYNYTFSDNEEVNI